MQIEIKRKKTIVILDNNYNKKEMIEQIKEYLDAYDEKYRKKCLKEKTHFTPYYKHTQVLCRVGSPFLKYNLELCNFNSVNSIIINVDGDYNVIKTIMSCKGLIEELKSNGIDENKLPYITAVIENIKNMPAARIAGGKHLEVVCYEEIMSRIMASSSRTPGLSHIFTELFKYDENEIYEVHKSDIVFPKKLKNSDKLDNLSLYQINEYLNEYTIVGGYKGEIRKKVEVGKIKTNKWVGMKSCLLPTMKSIKFKDVDNLFILQEDDEKVIASNIDVSKNNEDFKIAKHIYSSKSNIIVGINNLLMIILSELEKYLKNGTNIFVLDTQENINKHLENRKNERKIKRIENINILWVPTQIDNYNELHNFVTKPDLPEIKVQ